MIKSLKSLCIAALSAISIYAGPVLAAGTLPLAMAQQIDINGQPLAGCQVTFYVAGTVATLQNNFADFGLTQAQANPLSCDQTGRIPMFWLADGLIHVRLTDSFGTPIIDTTMQVLGPSSGGGGGGGTVDPTTILSTGDIKPKYGTGPISGFVRLNALTVGNASSGATERANADTQAAFIYLYGVDPNLVVSGGRTGNALNDYNAGKTITLPDFRGRTMAGLADMGNSVTTALTSVPFGNSVTTLGSTGGSQTFTLLATHLPPHTHSGSGVTGNENQSHTHNGSGVTGPENQTHTHNYNAGLNGVTYAPNAGSASGFNPTAQVSGTENQQHNHNFSLTTAAENQAHNHNFSFTTDGGTGGSSPFPTVTPTGLVTVYMKL